MHPYFKNIKKYVKVYLFKVKDFCVWLNNKPYARPQEGTIVMTFWGTTIFLEH